MDVGISQGSLYYQNHNNNALEKTLGNESLLETGHDDKLKQACRDFEAIFVKQMLDAMRKTVPQGTLMNGGQGEEVFEDMLYEKYAEEMTKTARLGIADLLYSQLK